MLVDEARAAGAVIVGEDLGTVEERMREVFAERRVLGTSMAWFERDEHGAPLPPVRWRELCLATVGTHDMPPIRASSTATMSSCASGWACSPGPRPRSTPSSNAPPPNGATC